MQTGERPGFPELLRTYRCRTDDPDRRQGGPLSQEKLAELLSLRTGFTIDRNKVAKWESGKSTIHHQDERRILTTLVAIFYEYGSLRSLEKANSFLQSGDYRALNDVEIAEINPQWISAIPLRGEALRLEEAALIPKVETGGLAETRQRVYFKERENVFPPVTSAPKSGPGCAPPVPSLIVGRDEDLLKLKKCLGIGVTARPVATLQILTAIKGWPGVGKTTVASALAYDDEILEVYPDGVLWVSLGQEPNLLAGIVAWGRALGTTELLYSQTVQEAHAQLAALLRDKRMLLIIDDVWQPEHAIPFRVGGRHCATLVTTRRDDVANALVPTAANIYRLKVLKDEDALQLLKQLAPTVVKKYPRESLVLVQDLEGLPLALQVAGRLLNTEFNQAGGLKVVALIDELRKGAKLLEAQAPADRADLVHETTPTIAALLQKSLDRLDDTTRDCYAYLGAFAPKPATFDLEAMKFAWEMEEPRPIVRTLVDRGLLEYVPELGRYQMHALLVMLAKTLLTEA